jgi:asparagine synthase (glutamine-hydrolysing)
MSLNGQATTVSLGLSVGYSMCGIAGIYKFNVNKRMDPEIITKMRDTLAHRGPDDNGVYLSPDNRFYLVNTRLSIIDLTFLAHQPMSDQKGSVWISYNGEIYNYLMLQSELKRKGYTFRSNSDTEIIIYGYEEWGIDGLLKRLRGMFAFAIYDSRAKDPKLILARDRLGIKPLYYYQDNELLIFSSEVRAIVESGIIGRERNREADIAFLIFGNIPAHMTTVKNIFSMPCASYMMVENGKKRLVKYYELYDAFARPKIKYHQDIYNNLLSILTDTVNMHLISDAPLGVFLSGGIDSSCLVALASKMKGAPLTTLSVIFDEEQYCELPYQRIVAKRYGTDHREIKVTEKDFYNEIDNIFDAMDQPTVDGINTYFVSRAAKQVGLKAVLSGLGGDEIFCGYESFRKIKLLKTIQGLPRLLRFPFALTGILNAKWRKLIFLRGNDELRLYLSLRSLFSHNDVARILGISEKEVSNVLNGFKFPDPNFKTSVLSPVDWLSYMEISFYLQNQLLKDTDFISMHHSIETRVPFLDHVLVDYVASIDSSLKIDKNIPKPILAKSLQGILPDEVIFRKKRGFVFPFDLWIKRRGRELFKTVGSNGSINKKYAEGLWQKFEQGSLHWSRLWALIVMARQK